MRMIVGPGPLPRAGGANKKMGGDIVRRRPIRFANAAGLLQRKGDLVYSSVKAIMALPRLELICVFPPASTTMYCLPPTI